MKLEHVYSTILIIGTLLWFWVATGKSETPRELYNLETQSTDISVP